MPDVQVSTYFLSTRSQLVNGAAVRTNMVVLTPQAGSAVSVVYLFYLPATVVGYLTGTQLAAYFPREALDTHLHLLQTESPIHVFWTVSATDSTVLTQFALATSDEYLGEGFVDQSP